MKNILDSVYNYLIDAGISASIASFLKILLVIIGILVISWLSDIITKKFILKAIEKYAQRSKNKWDDKMAEKRVFSRLSHLSPALVIHFSINLLITDLPHLVSFMHKVVFIYMTVIIVMVFTSFTSALNDIYREHPISKDRPIKGYIQLINILVFIIGLFFIYKHITGKDISVLLAGLGAMAAVLMLVFKDTILGLVASIQLTANNMVKIGDWIAMPGHKADGTIVEITLNTVKVQNWDKTITTIPTYALVSESFSNWRGMEESGGRRIKRSINLDMSSVHFCTPEQLAKFRKIKILQGYVEEKLAELESYNLQNNIDNSVLVNGRRMTNLGTFRKYIELYLRNHPKIHNEMTFLVRQLQPSEKGIPIEIYVFSNDQAWANYESIQADIFDHILAVIPEFDLCVFQQPSGYDLGKLKL